ncbi:MAG: Tat pathway signal protein [Alphaproteobacteria bacterium]|nr:Tat pathway signal protein [Alphaproteobacteria bacterium]
MSSGSTVSSSGEGVSLRSYDEAVRQVWRPLAVDGGLRELVRAGTLAANSHNTQPWRFSLADHEVAIHPDLTRRCPAVDPDDNHLFASLGCAVENIVQAAPVLGFDATPAPNVSNDGAITLALQRRQPTANPLADAIVRRQCTRADFDGRAIDKAAGSHEGVTCLLLTDRSRMEAIAGHVVEGNTAQMRDPAFMAELKAWIRFDDRMALAHRDGLTSRASGNPSLPAWLARLLLPLVMTEKGEAAKINRQIRSSACATSFRMNA